MIPLSNGHCLHYVAASGALAFDGLGWPWERPLVAARIIRPELFTTFIKSLTLRPTVGNLNLWWPWNCIRLIRGGAVNRVGLTNPGLDAWCRRYGPTVSRGRYRVGSSVFGTREDILAMLPRLDEFPFVAHELNVSCPNTGHGADPTTEVVATVKAARRVTRRPLVLKLGVQQDVVAIARGVEGVAEAISINTVPWEIAFRDKPRMRSPLEGLERRLGTPGKGGVSGVPAQRHNWAAVHMIRALAHGVPVIGPSVMSYGDVAKVRGAGAEAISFGTCFMRTPWRPTAIALADMRAQGLTEEDLNPPIRQCK